MGLVLLHTYQAYQPTPAGAWRELHGLYRYAEFHGCQQQSLAELNQGEVLTVTRSYLQALMLGLCSPYQLPPGECQAVHAFLARWVDRAGMAVQIEDTDPLGHFLLDLDADHPASPFPRDVSVHNQPGLRSINAVELARVVHGFVTRLQKGGAVGSRELGFECAGPVCVDTLKRMLRFWGLAARRQFARRERRQLLSICVGLPAVHFFVNGQQALPTLAPPTGQAGQAPSQAELEADASDGTTAPAATSQEFRMDNRWQVRDESASGMLLARVGDLGPSVRIGDLIGLHQAESERWRLGVVRWVKSPDSRQVEMGVEMLAPAAEALAMRPQGMTAAPYEPVLLLPPVPALRRPAMLLATRGTLRAGEAFELTDGQSAPRTVHILSIAERSGSFVQAVFADAAH
jgi:cyclic-di-GMP-binding protein